MTSYVCYTVNTTTTNEKYSYSQCQVIRRYSDFLWLHDILATDYPYAIIPPMPEKNQMNRFEIDFVESRRAALQSFLCEIAKDELLKEAEVSADPAETAAAAEAEAAEAVLPEMLTEVELFPEAAEAPAAPEAPVDPENRRSGMRSAPLLSTHSDCRNIRMH